jgi:hypothetical protein
VLNIACFLSGAKSKLESLKDMKLEEGVWQEERDKCEGEERTTESNGDR